MFEGIYNNIAGNAKAESIVNKALHVAKIGLTDCEQSREGLVVIRAINNLKSSRTSKARRTFLRSVVIPAMEADYKTYRHSY